MSPGPSDLHPGAHLPRDVFRIRVLQVYLMEMIGLTNDRIWTAKFRLPADELFVVFNGKRRQRVASFSLVNTCHFGR